MQGSANLNLMIKAARKAGRSLVKDFRARVEAIISLGLGYLSMDRSSTALSPGELQRVRLAAQVRAEHPGAVMISAGMSGDLEQAVAHGATHLRVGSAILGDRQSHR